VSRPARLAAFGGLLVLAVLWSVRPGGEPQLPLDRRAPPLRLPALAGGEVDLGSFRGRLVLLNFWASWCPPCVRETPSLEALHRALSEQGLVVVGVSVDESTRALRRFVDEHGVSFLVLRDPSGLFAERVYRTVEFPTTYLIDADGIVRERYVGPVEWDAPAVLDHLRRRLEAAQAS
jgi:peroxiredoxin